MSRYLGGIGVCVAALVLAVGVSNASAAGKKKVLDVKVTGEIAAVSADEKTVTVAMGKAPKGKDAPTKDIKLDAKTVIDFVGIDNQDEKKLQKGYFVMAVMGENDTASALSVKKTAFTKK